MGGEFHMVLSCAYVKMDGQVIIARKTSWNAPAIHVATAQFVQTYPSTDCGASTTAVADMMVAGKATIAIVMSTNAIATLVKMEQAVLNQLLTQV